MSFVRKVDPEKSWAPIVVVATILTSVTIVFLLLADTSAPVSATPPAAGRSYQAADRQPPSDPAEAEQARADPALYQDPDAPTADQTSASETPPVPQPGVPYNSENSSPSAREQHIFKSRRALETVDPREFLRQATPPR